MKIDFKNDEEKECLKYILTDWFINNTDDDVLGCEPACRNLQSPGCEYCIEDTVKMMLNKNKLEFWCFGGEDWVQKQKIERAVINGTND